MTDRPRSNIDYNAVIEEFSHLPRGQVMRIPRVTNITYLKEKFNQRGLVPQADFRARNQGPHCVIKRLSDIAPKEG